MTTSMRRRSTSLPSSADPYWLLGNDFTGPAQKAGEKIAIVDFLDPLKSRRMVWQCLPGQRRVMLAHELGYDTPNTASGGAAAMDEATVFNGGLDRFDFKLIGKRVILIPYDTFKLFDEPACPESKRCLKGHPGLDCLRW
jgi:hypothetical protein